MNRTVSKSICHSSGIKRRTFIKTGTAAVAGVAMKTASAAQSRPTIVVTKGTNLAKMVEVGISKMGGWEKFFKSG